MSSQQYQHRVVETVATKETRISCPLGGRVDPVLSRSEITRTDPQPAEKATVPEDNDEVGNPADNNDPRNGEAGTGVGSGGGGGTLIKIQLPESLESLPRADHFPSQRHRWNTNEEIAAILISFDRHSEWLAKEVKIRPKSGSMLLYSRKKVRYRRDGYCWKKRKDGKTTREDHMKLKVQGTECIYGCYVHSAILPTFHRRCYWLLQNPDIVLVHYLNVPYPDDSKLVVVASVSLWGERKEWTKEELISQLKPMFFSEDEPNLNNELEISTAETVEAIVCQLMEKQRAARLANHAHPTVSTANNGPSKLTTLTFSDQRNDNSPPVVTNSRLALPSPSTSSNDAFRGTKSNNAHPPAPVAVTHSSTRAFHVRHSADSNEALTTAVTDNPAPRQQRPPSVPTPDLAAVNNNHDPRHAPLLLNLSQLQNAGGGLLILNSGSSLTSFLPMATPSSLQRWEPLPTETSPPSQSDAPGYADVMQMPTLPEKANLDANADSKASSVQTAKCGVTFSETLDLTQEDIQQTLSANLPMYEDAGRHSHLHQDMLQFLDVGGNHDDLFANLDAFDMLADLPEFDCHDHTTTDTPVKSESISLRSPETLLEKPPEKRYVNTSHHVMVNIVDYSPEWSPTEGGTKVLVTGPWQTVAGWTILFGDTPAPATLIQHGVLRCYTPSHPAGEVTLQVARDGLVVSNSVCFTYRSTTVASRASSSPNQALFHCKLLQRLRQVTDGLDLENGPLKTNLANLEEKFRNVCHADTDEWRQFEDSLGSLCLQWKNRPWKRNYAFSLPAGDSSLLHLASALGLTRVASSLIEWRLDNSALVLEQEVNVLGRDAKGFTPLMWSCARGHHDMAALLAQYEPAALVVVDAQGRSPAEVARQAGFVLLAADIESRRILGARSPSEMPVPSRSSSISGGKNDKGRGVASRPSFHSPSPSPSPQLGPPTSSDLMWNADGTRQVRLAKRSSMDNATPTSHAATSSDWQRKSDKNHKLSRNDRSLSLPLGALPPIDDRHRERSPALSMDATSALCESAPVLLPPRPQPVARTATPPLPPATADLDVSTVMLTDPCSPLIDVEGVSEHEPESPLSQPIEDGVQNIRRESASSVDLVLPGLVGDQDTRVLTLAEQIIAAMPDRIKNESEDMVVEDHVGEMTVIDLKTDDLLMEEEATDTAEFTFEFSDHNYRYCDIGTPSSSVSPASSSCLQSPCSFSMDSPSPPPTTADFTEFLQASSNVFVRDFSNLTLSDREQRELYEAAKIIQKAYRSYKGRKKAEEQDKERTAAIIIQNYYRRYKQYVYLKQMTRAAVVIQNQFRSYYEHKRFKKSQESSSSTPSVCSPSSYRLFRENSLGGNGRQSREGTPTSSALKRTYSQRRQHQAARKIQQFMRQSKNKLQRERALAAERANQTNSNISVGCPHHTPTCACSITPPTSASSNRRL